MQSIPREILENYRAHTFHTTPGKRLTTKEEAIAFVNQRGFVYFWPIKNITLPSLWVAVAGYRPVAEAHDDPGHVTWGWKDSLLGQQAWYYAKILRQKATMVSMEIAPYFYALTENYGSPEEDYLTIYRSGRLTLEGKQIFEALLDKGAMDTISLRKAAHLSSSESETRFNRALSDLQSNFMILPVAVTQAGAWRYAFAYDLVSRRYPEIVEAARFIAERQARQKLSQLYLESVGIAQLRDLTRLFGWSADDACQALDNLVQAGQVKAGLLVEGHAGEWYASQKLLGA